MKKLLSYGFIFWATVVLISAATFYVVYDSTTGAVSVSGLNFTNLVAKGSTPFTVRGNATANSLDITNSIALQSLTASQPVRSSAGKALSSGAIVLSGSDVSGQLPLANIVNVSAASRLIGRGSAAGAGVQQEITLGANLTMTGTTLSATGGGGAQTPWASDIDAATFSLTNLASLQTVGGIGGVSIGDSGTHWFSLSAPTTITTNVNVVSPAAPEVGIVFASVSVGTNMTLTATNISGDVTSSGTVITITNGAVTYAKMQNISTVSKLLGRGSAAGAGSPQEITLGANLTMTGTTLSSSGGGGSATNAISTISSNGVNIATGVTNLNIIGATRITNVSGNVTIDLSNIAKSSFPFTIGDGVNAITTGLKYGAQIPFDAWITSVTLGAAQSGSIVIDLWKDTDANFPPTVSDTITASAKPTLSAAIHSTTSVSTWITNVTAGDWIYINVDSATTVTRITGNIHLLKL